MTSVEENSLVWARMPQYSWLPGVICRVNIPSNTVTRVCTKPNAVCVFFFGIYEYATMDKVTLCDYRAYHNYHKKQRLHKIRRFYLDQAIIEADRFEEEPWFRCSIIGSIHKTAGKIIEAISFYEESLSYHVDLLTFTELMHCYRIVCRWKPYYSMASPLNNHVEKRLQHHEPTYIDSHTSIIHSFSPQMLKAIAMFDAEVDEMAVGYWQRNYKFESHRKNKRIKIGYVSSDFRDHTLSHLFQSIPGLHDRNRFEIYCYALNENDDSIFYKNIASEAEHFINLSKKSDGASADRIHSDKIDILINLNGHTEGGRNEIFALRPAPIQVMWLGFPSTMGAKYMDYFISDVVASPLEQSNHYTECLAHMPHTHFIGDHKRMFPHLLERIDVIDSLDGLPSGMIINGIDLCAKLVQESQLNRKISICISSNLIERKNFLDNPLLAIEGVDILNGKMHSGEIISRNLAFTSRTQYGLPTGSIVFGNFNQLYKLDRQTFHLWLDIVTEISGSVLWLLRYPAEAEAYLRNEAEEYGFTEKHRIIFSDVASKEEHVRRCQLADICLDTISCNGHTTSMDVLWSGTPLITLLGDTLASRISASMLHVIGCQELIARNVDEYKRIAINLANNPDQLMAVREKIEEQRDKSPLFDCAHFTRDLESLYDQMQKNYLQNSSPKHITNSTCSQIDHFEH